ncbi:MAG: carboxypeptidase M32 [Anaerolineae bacterium]|nr:MAG: carboxypeptidase M32 [Anaerolineae bacterium]
MKEKLDRLNAIIAEISDIGDAMALLGWDQETYMPTGGAETRGQVSATLGRLVHERATSDEVGKLLEALVPWSQSELKEDSDEFRIIKNTKRGYDQQVKIPAAMIEERAKLQAAGNIAWREARQNDDWAKFEPYMDKWVDFVKRTADLFKPYDHPYDVLLDFFEPNMKTADVKVIFDGIRPSQVELIDAISKKPEVDDSVLHLHYDRATQLKMGEEVSKAFGFDYNRGRQDEVHHPFASNLGYGDQRITYRVDENFFNPYFFGNAHETGHALYEQGVPKEKHRTALYGATSLAIHESQSRLWENLVGRSKPFWEWYFPTLQKQFPAALGNVKMDTFYRAINKVKPSLIRVEADEATYNLHIMLRLEIEIGLVEGSISVKDLPEVWNTRFKEYLGITPPNNAQGVLQDVHWSFGLYGYFATYALGNLVSAQLWEKITQANPNLPDQIRKGDFSHLLGWLRENIHVHGSKYEPQELVQRVTGTKIDGAPYVKYLQTKFGEIYGL